MYTSRYIYIYLHLDMYIYLYLFRMATGFSPDDLKTERARERVGTRERVGPRESEKVER